MRGRLGGKECIVVTEEKWDSENTGWDATRNKAIY